MLIYGQQEHKALWIKDANLTKDLLQCRNRDGKNTLQSVNLLTTIDLPIAADLVNFLFYLGFLTHSEFSTQLAQDLIGSAEN